MPSGGSLERARYSLKRRFEAEDAMVRFVCVRSEAVERGDVRIDVGESAGAGLRGVRVVELVWRQVVLYS
jgi:hypothetical protein